MKISSAWNLRSIAGKIMMVLVLAAMICSMDVASSFGEDRYEQRGRGYDNGRYEHRGRGYDRDRYGHRGRGYYYEGGRRVYRPYGYGYSEPVYVPPPVYYEPPPPPGLHIFLPF